LLVAIKQPSHSVTLALPVVGVWSRLDTRDRYITPEIVQTDKLGSTEDYRELDS
jgi:hypothetical protein